MSMWQPIETAPRDGRILRLFIPGRPDLEGMKGRWNNSSEEWESHPVTMTLGPELEVPDPTFWMPLTPHPDNTR